jgi:peroxiredoxin
VRAKKIILTTVSIAILCWTITPAFASGRKAPDFRLKDINGNMVQFSDFLNSGPILVDFWATWCVPCIKEMEHFQKLYQQYQERGFLILGIAVDNPRSASKIKPTVRAKGWTFPILLDPKKEVLKKFGGGNLIPFTAVVSPNGDIISVHKGYKAGNEKVVEQEILPYLLSPEPVADEAAETEQSSE